MTLRQRALAFVLGLAALHGGEAGLALGETRRADAIGHGRALNAGLVGPTGAGVVAATMHPGGVLRDGQPLGFAREVGQSASYDGFRVEGAHLLVERVTFTGPLDVHLSRPLVLRGVAIQVQGMAHWALHARPEAGPVLFLWSQAGAAPAPDLARDPARRLERGLYLRNAGAIVYRSHITRAADGIQVHAPGAQIVETVVDGLVQWPGTHNDGIQLLGTAREALILRSRIENPNRQTSAVNLAGAGNRIIDSHLAGGGWTLYAGAHIRGAAPGGPTGLVIEGNTFGSAHFPRAGHFGAVTGWPEAGNGNRWARNRLDDGSPIHVGRR